MLSHIPIPFTCLLFFLPVLACSCPSVLHCGDSPITFAKPFTTSLECGGTYVIRCNDSTPEVQFHENESWYVVKNISYYPNTLIIQDPALSKQMQGSDCNFIYEFTNPIPHFNPTNPVLYPSPNHTLFDCNLIGYDFSHDIFHELYHSTPCNNYILSYSYTLDNQPHDPSSNECYPHPPQPPSFEWKLSFEEDGDDLSLLSAGFSQKVALKWYCFHHHMDRDHCSSDSIQGGSRSHERNIGRKIGIGVGVGGAGFIIGCFLCFLLYQRRKRRQRSNSSNLLIRTGTASSKPSSLNDPELGSTNYLTHVFLYEELQEATNGFDASRELGDGGFGTVYKGQLRDGRVVAVKRLYKNNCKRVEQFVNEVYILSRLRHQNLVTLYGCTSRHSRELLLVYEFVPNGTVADHLHGPRAAEGALPWAVRLSIAIETADALAYLHAVEPQIIHRDVKTNNILLDNSFHVKVADFGLSRLFPVHATHVSTLPQGTPGYVDPEYHQCYQLTDKSDVYSFGVVLVELISSKPAVDISRHRHEINLANLAINKIQNRELEQLVDPGLGYQADWEMERMITLVAELAFRCLQGDGDMRPSIKDVLEELRGIQRRGERAAEADVQTGEDTGLLKNTITFSPDTVTVEWESRLTTPNTSA